MALYDDNNDDDIPPPFYNANNPTIYIDDIPTIPALYRTGKLHPPAQSLVNPAPSGRLNERVGLHHGDITQLAVDAIVNAANSDLSGGGGVDGAIHRAAGPRLLEECLTLDGCPTGDARLTKGYGLLAKRVIQAVGPIYKQNKPAQMAALLRGCYQKSLELAAANGLRTVAFSAVSAGVYGYPSRDAAEVAAVTVREFLESDQGASLKRVVFVTFVDKDAEAYNEVLPSVAPSLSLSRSSSSA